MLIETRDTSPGGAAIDNMCFLCPATPLDRLFTHSLAVETVLRPFSSRCLCSTFQCTNVGVLCFEANRAKRVKEFEFKFRLIKDLHLIAAHLLLSQSVRCRNSINNLQLHSIVQEHWVIKVKNRFGTSERQSVMYDSRKSAATQVCQVAFHRKFRFRCRLFSDQLNSKPKQSTEKYQLIDLCLNCAFAAVFVSRRSIRAALIKELDCLSSESLWSFTTKTNSAREFPIMLRLMCGGDSDTSWSLWCFVSWVRRNKKLIRVRRDLGLRRIAGFCVTDSKPKARSFQFIEFN